MAKFKYAAPPATFKRNIKFKTLDGVTADFDVTFNYRNKKEAAKLNDEFLDLLSELREKEDSKQATPSEVAQSIEDGLCAYLLKALNGWELEEAINEASVRRLINEYPAAANTIRDTYHAACSEGRLGN